MKDLISQAKFMAFANDLGEALVEAQRAETISDYTVSTYISDLSGRIEVGYYPISANYQQCKLLLTFKSYGDDQEKETTKNPEELVDKFIDTLKALYEAKKTKEVSEAKAAIDKANSILSKFGEVTYVQTIEED